MEPDSTRLAALNLETGQIGWPELQRHFARGAVVRLAPELDLVKVAAAFSGDDTAQVQRWRDDGLLATASDEHARDWQQRQPTFWAIVVAPFVLVQEA